MRRILLAVFATVVVWSAGTAHAAVIVFNFDDLLPFSEVPTNYGGASWSGFIALDIAGATSQPNAAATIDTTGVLDFASGFTSLNFSVGVFAPATFAVYDDLGGSGVLLGSLTIDNPPADPLAFSQTGVVFSGIGRSVVVTGGVGQTAWDDVTLTTSQKNEVPEPASWALGATILGMMGLRMRRRSLASASKVQRLT